jgi:hypothetical protein
VAGEHLDAVAEIRQALQGVEEVLGSLDRLDGEVRTRGVADEERVSGEHEPRLVGTAAVDDRKGAVLGTVPRRVNRPHDDVAELDLRSVLERLVRKRSARRAVHPHRKLVLERKAAVPRDMVCMRVRLEHDHELHDAPLALLEILLDRIRWIHDGRYPCVLVTDEIRGASEIVVDELREQHVIDASTARGYLS